MRQDDESLSNGEEKPGEPNDELEWLDVIADADAETAEQSAGDDQSPDSSKRSDVPASIDDTVEIKAASAGITHEGESDLETQILEPAPRALEEEGDIDATLVDLPISKPAEDGVPEWLDDSEPEPENEGEMDSGEDDLGWLDKLADADMAMAGNIEAIADEPQTTNWDDQNDVPDDPDEAMAWLEQLAAQQGASAAEPPTLSGLESEQHRPVVEDQPMAIEDSQDEIKTPHEIGSSPDVAEEFDRFAAAVESELQRIEQFEAGEQDESTSPTDHEYREIPEDPDEAMAWLEKLAARQGAQIEELPSLSAESEVDKGAEVEKVDAEAPPAIQGSADEHLEAEEFDEIALPMDDNEALAWLEELADEEPMDTEEDVSLVEEPITPARPLDVESARQEVEELFPDSYAVQDLEFDGDLDDEDEDALAWMEQLVVDRQEIEDSFAGQPIDDESDTEEIRPPDWLVDSDGSLEEVDSDVDEESRELVEELAAIKDEEDQASIEITEALLEEELAAGEPMEALVSETAFDIEDALPADSQVDYPLDTTEDELLISGDEDESAVLPVHEKDEVEDDLVQELEESPDWIEEEPQSVETLLEIDESHGEIEVEEVYEEAFPPIEVQTEAPGPDSEMAAAVDEVDITAEIDEEEAELEWMAESAEIDAEAWLEAEEAKATTEPPPVVEEGEHLPIDFQTDVEPQADTILQEEAVDEPSEEIVEDDVLRQPDPELLEKAREAIASGNDIEAVESFDALVRRGHGVPYLIADLELSIEEHGAQISLQRVLGDAYAQNGQLSKALSTYREALDQL